jgi:CBS domain containing-hemolysin-like protein
MTPLAVFLLACAGIYLGAVEVAFTGLIRLSWRLEAERNKGQGPLRSFLEEPMLLLVPVRLLAGLVTALATMALARAIGVSAVHRLLIVLGSAGAFFIVCQVLLPLAVVGRNPERMLEVLVGSFAPVARMLAPVTHGLVRLVGRLRREPAPEPAEPGEQPPEAAARPPKRRTKASSGGCCRASWISAGRSCAKS